jgi:hypothetical protein
MANMTLGLDEATIVIQIRNRTYNLTASTQELSIPGTPNVPKNLRFRYRDTYESAIDVGTLRQVLEEVQGLLNVPASTPPAVTSFVEQWGTVKTKLNEAPIIGNALATVLDTNVRIFEIEVDLTRKVETNGTKTYKGKFRLGLMFTPDPASRPRLFNIQVLAFGGVLSVELEGDANNLGFTW